MVWCAQDFCFGGDNYITKKVSRLSCTRYAYWCLYIPTKYYRNTSKGIKVMEIIRIYGRKDAMLIAISPEPIGRGIKTCLSGYAYSSYVKSASAAGAEEIITMMQRLKRRCSSMLWSMESMTRHNRSNGHPLYLGLAPDVLTVSCLWILLGHDDRVRSTLRASPSL